MELSDGEIADVDMIGVLKRGPTMDEDSSANSHQAKLPRDSKKVRSKLSDSGAFVEGVSRGAVDQESPYHAVHVNKDVI